MWIAEKGSEERAEKDVYLLAEMISALDLDDFCCHSLFPSHKFTRIGISKHILFSYLPILHDEIYIYFKNKNINLSFYGPVFHSRVVFSVCYFFVVKLLELLFAFYFKDVL